MAEFTLFTNPMSRGSIALWALEEARADYSCELVRWDAKPEALLAANSLGKVPTLIHHAADGDRIITEAAAICAYLSDTVCPKDIVPVEKERTPFYRWLFFTAGPIEQAITAKHYGFEPDEKQQVSVGFGSYELALAALSDHLAGNRWVCGDRFTMADVYVGAQCDWGLQFKTFPETDAFTAYVGRCRERDGYKAMVAAMQAQQAELES